MSTDYRMVAEVARWLDKIADEIDAHRQARHPVFLPPELTSAARRIVAAADWGRAQVVTDRMSVGDAALQVLDMSEVVTASIIRTRLVEGGRVVSLPTLTVALHRACTRGDLISPARGRFRLPTPAERKLADATRDDKEQ